MHALIILILLLTVGCSNNPTSPTNDCIVNGITLKEEKIQEWRIINDRWTLITVWQPATTIKLCD